ncbi:MAG: hypothetical protein JWL77_3328 [Chthonomonadaceae bacterium]|nr:hypothetical protein [Chthonomonadaceae bacterium]
MSDWKMLKDTLGLTLGPLNGWPGPLTPASLRERAPFAAALNDTLMMLKSELGHLGARNIVLAMAVRKGDLRPDGFPRANASGEHPGVILSFYVKEGPRQKHFDHFTRWEHNLRVLTMNLNHLRSANLYGAEDDGDPQYAGWRVMPSEGKANRPPPHAAPGRTPKRFNDDNTAAQYLASYVSNVAIGVLTQSLLNDPELFKKTLRDIQTFVHPDRYPGATEKALAHERFVLVSMAGERLKKRHDL